MRFRVPGFQTATGLGGSTATGTDTQSPSAHPNDVPSDHEAAHNEKDVRVGSAGSLGGYSSDDDSSLEKIDTNAEHGVQTIQAMTQVWSQRDIYAAYIMIWLIAFIMAFTSGIVGTLTPYVTSNFQEHSLTALTGVISSLIAGIWKLPYAKIMNIWGRAQALTLGVLSVTIGLIMMAGCNNVRTYCAAMTFFYVGQLSIDFSITVFIADTSKLRNRGFFIAYTSSPWLITTWVYGFAASDIVNNIGFRWGFGVFSIVVSVPSTLPHRVVSRSRDKY